jgi:hypothetical protein
VVTGLGIFDSVATGTAFGYVGNGYTGSSVGPAGSATGGIGAAGRDNCRFVRLPLRLS